MEGPSPKIVRGPWGWRLPEDGVETQERLVFERLKVVMTMWSDRQIASRLAVAELELELARYRARIVDRQ